MDNMYVATWVEGSRNMTAIVTANTAEAAREKVYACRTSGTGGIGAVYRHNIEDLEVENLILNKGVGIVAESHAY